MNKGMTESSTEGSGWGEADCTQQFAECLLLRPLLIAQRQPVLHVAAHARKAVHTIAAANGPPVPWGGVTCLWEGGDSNPRTPLLL
jgi:hypothetical protein